MTSLFDIAGNQLKKVLSDYNVEFESETKQMTDANIQNNKSENYPFEPTSTSVVEIISFFLGVNKSIFEKDDHPFRIDTFNKLHENKDARIIRTLCVFRIKLMRNYDRINSLMRYELKNLDSMDDLFPAEDLAFLTANNINLQKPNYHPQRYIADVNGHISENISKCKDLFPLYIKFDYIKNLFLMPEGSSGEGIKRATNKYTLNAYDYPYSVYLNWKDTKTLERNLMFNDKFFLQSLYEMNNDKFVEAGKLKEATTGTKVSIYEYLQDNPDSVMIVDCENSDVFKLYSVLKTLTVDELKKIRKIILVDDINTSSAWKLLEQLAPAGINVEYIEAKRVHTKKSLVDIRLALEISREFHCNAVSSFVVCSSDSDFWAVVEALPDVDFLFMVEDIKCGYDIQKAFEEEGITWCSIDQFGDKSSEFKVQALKLQMQTYITDRLHINMKEMEDAIFADTRINFTEGEQMQFRNNYIKTLKFSVAESGDVEVVIKEK